MAGRTFLDTDVLVYAFDRSQPEKRKRALEILKAVGESYVVSSHVLAEFYWVVTRKLERPLDEDTARSVVKRLSSLPVIMVDARTVMGAVTRSRKSGLKLWDALAVQAAVDGGCTRLLSEDIESGEQDEMVVENPFE